MTKKMLTVEDILVADDLVREKVDVPEWGGHVYMRILSMQETQDLGKEENVSNARLLAAVLCDDCGKLIFSEDQVSILEKKSSRVILRLVEKATALNGMSVSDEESVKN